MFDGSARAKLWRWLFTSKDELTISWCAPRRRFVDLERFVNFEAGKRIYVQCALLYSDPAAKRRLVRVHNVVYGRSEALGALQDRVCGDGVLSVSEGALAHQVLPARIFMMASRPGRMQISGDALKKARDVLQTTCVEALYEYRVACAARSPPGQLILPESIKLLPLLVLGAFKGSLLRSASPQAPGADACERAATLELAMAAHPAWLCRCALVRGYLFPRDAGSLNPIPASASACAPLSLLDCASHLLFILPAARLWTRGRRHYRAARRRAAIECENRRGLNALREQMARDAPRPPPCCCWTSRR